ncbi:MAG TPA: zinc-dependent metalloprotease [Candidatus Dormibacteraeota bacterium]|nr:zinc-dependent metalloprotease [Candidatus Dormibacteraeota bacterium]
MARTKSALRGLAAGVAVGAVAYAVVDAVRPRPGAARIVDWDEIRDQAISRLDPDSLLDARRRRTLETRYRKLAAELEPALISFVGASAGDLPPFQALDRAGWVDLNVGIMRDALEPLVAAQERMPNSRMVEMGRSVLDRYVGLILGFLSGRVLGQYDPRLLGHEPSGGPGLYLVEPNIADFQQEAELPTDPLRRWLILHEMTHAWQFGAHPWLRDHLNGMLREVLGAAIDARLSSLGRLLALTIGGGEQRSVVSRLQSTMSLVEGYSNLVMDVVGRELLPDFARLEAAHQARVDDKTVFERLFWKVTGLELKLQQYVVGERFCKQVHERHGIAVLNRAWERAENLPTADELQHPDRWAARMGTAL